MRIMTSKSLCFPKFNPAILFCLIVAGSWISGVYGEEVRLKPKISIRETYNDNIDFVIKDDERDELDDFITVYKPSVAVTRNTEKSRILLDASLEIEDYQDKDLDEVNQYYEGTLERDLSSSVTINGSSSFIRDTTLDNELEDTGLIYTRSERTIFRFKPGLAWRPSEVDNFSFNIGYTDARYEEEKSYSDYSDYDGVLSWGHTVSPEGAYFSISTGYRFTDFNTSEVQTYSMYSGLNLPLNPIWEVKFWVGIRRTISEYDQEETERNWGGIGYLSIERYFEAGSLSAELSKNLVPSGTGQSIERDRAKVNIDYRFTESLTGRLGGSWTSSESESSYRSKDDEYYSINSFLRYRLGENITTRISYTYSQRENLNNDAEAYRNVVFVQVTASLVNN